MKSATMRTILGLGMIGLLLMFWGFSTYGTLVDDEEGILAQEKVIDIAVDQMFKKIEGQGIAVDNFRQTLLDVFSTVIGEGGRAATAGTFFNAVAEQYPSVPEGLWRDLAATMNSSYDSFAAAQTTKVDKIRVYRTHLRKPQYVLAKAIGGFPTFDLEKAGGLILGKDAQEARKTGTVETVDPFKKK